MAKQDAIEISVTIETNLVACATNITWDYVQNTETDDPCKGDAGNTWLAPARSGKEIQGSLEGIIDYAAAYGMRDLASLLVAGTNATIVIEGPDPGDDRDTIEAIITRVGGAAGSTGKGTYSIDFVGDGTAPVLDVVV